MNCLLSACLNDDWMFWNVLLEMLNWCFNDLKDCEILKANIFMSLVVTIAQDRHLEEKKLYITKAFTQWVSQSSIETEHNNLDRSAGSSQNYSEIGQRYFMAIRTYFTRWLILMNSYDLTRTI